MDRRFKERLIGAVVLAGAAVLILPAVLNGPHAPLPEPADTGETTMRTETIDLGHASGRPVAELESPAPASPRPQTATEPARAATEDATHQPAGSEQEAGPDAAGAATAETPRREETPDAIASTPPGEKPALPAARAAPGTPPPADPKPASPARGAGPMPVSPAPAPAKQATAPAGAGWAVQVGTFASSSNATALAATLKARGYSAFVAPLESSSKTLYRVRVGPTADVESARVLEQRLEKEIPAADVVRLP